MLVLHRLDHHSSGLKGIWCRALPSVPVQARSPADVVPGWVPVAVQAGRSAAAVPPATSSLREGALILGDVPEDAGVTAVVVPVVGAEAKAVLVNCRPRLVGSTYGVACSM